MLWNKVTRLANALSKRDRRWEWEAEERQKRNRSTEGNSLA
jgi:hypothetical protein